MHHLSNKEANKATSQATAHQSPLSLSKLQQTIINRYQKGFPLCSEPFKTIASELGCSETEVIAALDELNQHNILSRIGPVFDHKKAGASTLAALAVPVEQLDDIAKIVNQFEQVNHNYAREHHYNLWFVVTASNLIELNKILMQIEQLTGLAILILPMEASYHIDLSFQINFDPASDKLNAIDLLQQDVKKGRQNDSE